MNAAVARDVRIVNGVMTTHLSWNLRLTTVTRGAAANLRSGGRYRRDACPGLSGWRWIAPSAARRTRPRAPALRPEGPGAPAACCSRRARPPGGRWPDRFADNPSGAWPSWPRRPRHGTRRPHVPGAPFPRSRPGTWPGRSGQYLKGGRAEGSGVGTPERSAHARGQRCCHWRGARNRPKRRNQSRGRSIHTAGFPAPAGILPRSPQPRLASSAAPASIAPSEARCATERPSSTRSSTRRNSIAKRSRPASSEVAAEARAGRACRPRAGA